MGDTETVDKQLPLKGQKNDAAEKPIVVKRNRPRERWTILIVLVVTILASLVFVIISGGSRDVPGEGKNTKNERKSNLFGPAVFEF